MLHVLDGDAIVEEFRAAGLPGESVVWREALLEGPWPRHLRGVVASAGATDALATRRKRRGRSSAFDVDDVVRATREAMLKDVEIVLWFDEDLFCRLHAAYFSAHLVGARMTNALGSHADRSDLRSLLDRRVALDPALGEAWHAYASPDPRGLVALVERFPWLRLHVERYPHVDDGLNTLERRAMAMLRDDGPLRFEELFRRVATGDFSPASYGLGDTELYRTLAELGPLVELGDRVAITHDGRQVLTGHLERSQLAPLDRWLGGVHLTGAGAWRWDGDALVPKP